MFCWYLWSLLQISAWKLHANWPANQNFRKKTLILSPTVHPFFVVSGRTKKMDVSKNRGTPKSSILIGCSIINHPLWGFPPIFGNTQMHKTSASTRIPQKNNNNPVICRSRRRPPFVDVALRNADATRIETLKAKKAQFRNRFGSRQFIATSAEVTLHGGLVRESYPKWPQFRSTGGGPTHKEKRPWSERYPQNPRSLGGKILGGFLNECFGIILSQNGVQQYLGGGFQTFFIFTPIWVRFPFWLIFFKGVETTNSNFLWGKNLGWFFCWYVFFFMLLIVTPPKFNIAPEKLPSQRESSLPTIIFRGYVKLREGIWLFNVLIFVERCPIW